MRIWLCKEHYEAACSAIGHEIEVCTIPNWSKQPCVVCSECANYLTSIDIIDPDNLISLLIEGYRRAKK